MNCCRIIAAVILLSAIGQTVSAAEKGSPGPATWRVADVQLSLEVEGSVLSDHAVGIAIKSHEADGIELISNPDVTKRFDFASDGGAMLSAPSLADVLYPVGQVALSGEVVVTGPVGQARIARPVLEVVRHEEGRPTLMISGEIDGRFGPVFELHSAKLFFDNAADSFFFESSELRLTSALAEQLGAPSLAGQSIGTARGRLNGSAALQPNQAVAAAYDRNSAEVAGGNNGTVCPTPVGPDLIVGDLMDVANYGSTGGIEAFTVGTFSCNVGNQNAIWIEQSNQHPVISQNMFRLKNGRFEHVGQAWLKHGFLALTDNICGCGCNGQGGSVLGVGCADPYTAGLNGQQGGMGPKWQVNAWTGAFSWPFQGEGQGGNSIFKRIQVAITDLEAAGAGGSTHYYMEGHYVSPDDSSNGNQDNNASYRRVFMTGSGTTWNVTLTGAPATVRTKPAIRAWKAADATVKETDFRVPNEGLFILASKVTDLGNGFWQYEYALQNLNSDRSAGSFSITVGNQVTVQNIGFHDVPYHSGEPFDGTDWTASVGGGLITWSTTPHSSNPNANALRWATMYNFRFEADVPPTNATATIGLFKPGTPSVLNSIVEGPGECSTDADCDDGLFCTGMEVCVVESGICRGALSPCSNPQTCDEANDTCINPIGCGQCRLYTDVAAPFCVNDLGDILAGLTAYAEELSCTTMFDGKTPGAQVFDAGCWVACDTNADCVGSLGVGMCVAGQCCDLFDISDLLAELNEYSDGLGCPDTCPPGACNFDTNSDTVMDCCKDGNTPLGGMSETDCYTQGGTYLGAYATCTLPPCSP